MVDLSSRSERYETGLKMRRSVLGDAYVDRAMAAKTTFDEDFQTFVTEGAWGSVWSRPHFSKRERSIVTLAILAALGRSDEFELHLRATLNTGASREDVAEMLMHVAVYAGVPAANHAVKLAKRIFHEMDTAPMEAGEAETEAAGEGALASAGKSESIFGKSDA